MREQHKRKHHELIDLELHEFTESSAADDLNTDFHVLSSNTHFRHASIVHLESFRGLSAGPTNCEQGEPAKPYNCTSHHSRVVEIDWSGSADYGVCDYATIVSS